MKFYYNDSIVGIMELVDCTNEQHFKFDKLFGYSEGSDFESLQKMKPWTFKFEILDVYEGSKFYETAITDIYLDGVDVH